MKKLDWALFLVIGIGAYVGGFMVGSQKALYEKLISPPPLTVHLVMDSLDLKLPLNPEVNFKVTRVETEEDFLREVQTADAALARVQWLLKIDRKPLPIPLGKGEQKIQLSPFFAKSRLREQEILPLLWGVPELFPEGLSGGWKFTDEEKSGVLMGLVLVESPSSTALLQMPPRAHHQLFQIIAKALIETGMGMTLTWQPTEDFPTVPPTQQAEAAEQYELSRFEMKQ